MLRNAKEAIKKQAPETATCLFIGTALTAPISRALTSGNLLAAPVDGILPYRFGEMTSLLKPSLIWTGSMVLTKLRPSLYSAVPTPK
ncbi:hypothetical protein Ciccas_009798 [Cichlidogyrus casuarinus]|uniref:Uncharacterized protein n=1 Tax=Cichlidogyrus casuarinus TaxID=1844966 RepID=A0ABD2PYU1_9PLAT